MSYVRIKQLKKSFAGQPVFESINMDIEQGEFITLLGPSGCGKSTLLRSLAGLHSVDGGEIIVDNSNITTLAPQKRGIGMVFQSYALFPNMTVAQNIAFGLKIKKYSPDEIKREVQRVIELVALEGREQHYPHQLSGGQSQRVALARALVVQPRILLLDEPLSALDAKIRKRLRQQLREIQKTLGLTTIFVTHDQEEAMLLSDRIFLMNQGHIIQSGTPVEIYSHPASEFVAGFMGNFNIIAADNARRWFMGCGHERVAIRPEAISIGSPPPESSHFSAPLTAEVITRQLLGNIVRYLVKLDGQELMVDKLNSSSQPAFADGERVPLFFSLNDIQPLRD